MSIKDLVANASNIQRRETKDRTEKAPKSAPVMIYGLTERMHDAEAKVETLQAQLEQALKEKGVIDLDRGKIVRVPGRQRQLSPDERAELKANLAKFPLVHPIVVFPLGDDRFELVSGHNRDDIYGELGRESIKAVISDVSYDQLEELAFFANLLSPSLSAWEKYVRLKAIQSKHPEIDTLDKLSDHTGMKRSTIALLMGFDRLPVAAHDAIKKAPTKIGISTIAPLVALTESGHAERVVAVLEEVSATEQIEQADIIRLAKQATQAAKPALAARPTPTPIKYGRKTYCKVLRVKNTIRVDVTEGLDAEEAEKVIAAALENLAKQKSE